MIYIIADRQGKILVGQTYVAYVRVEERRVILMSTMYITIPTTRRELLAIRLFHIKTIFLILKSYSI